MKKSLLASPMQLIRVDLCCCSKKILKKNMSSCNAARQRIFFLFFSYFFQDLKDLNKITEVTSRVFLHFLSVSYIPMCEYIRGDS